MNNQLSWTVEMAVEVPAIKYQPENERLFFDANPHLKGLWRLFQEGINLPGLSAQSLPSLAGDSFLPDMAEALAIIGASGRITSGVFRKVGQDQWQYKSERQDWIPEFPVSLPVLLAQDY